MPSTTRRGASDKVDTREIEKGLQRFLGSPLDQEAIGLAPTRVTGDGLFSAVTYDAIRENGRDGLLVTSTRSSPGPPLRLNADTELRAGYVFGRAALERGIGAAILPKSGGLERRSHILVRHDSQTRPFAPSSGLLAVVEYSYWDRNPIREGGLSQLDGRSSVFQAVGTRDRVFAQFSAGASFGAQAPVPHRLPSAGCSGCRGTRTTSSAATIICSPASDT